MIARVFTGRWRIPVVLGFAVVVGLIFTALTVGPNPAKYKISAAATHVFIDTPKPTLASQELFPVWTLIRRGDLLSQNAVTPPVISRAAAIAGVRVQDIGSEARTTANVPLDLIQPGFEERAAEIADQGRKFSIETQSRQNTPILDIYTRAPTTEQAIRLANAEVTALQGELKRIAERDGILVNDRLRLRQMGAPQGGVVSSGMPMAIAVLAFLISAALAGGGLLYATRRRDQVGVLSREVPPAEDPWPHTSRLLPWMLALFLAVLWLMPFNDIQLTVQLPIDMKFDRLVLPFVFAVWALCWMVGGRLTPRLRPTWIHAAVGAFVLVAFLSVILQSQHLNRMLELEGSVKQLPLLMAYVSLFLMMSTSIRGNEVWPFLKYTLILSVVCGLGVIFEYRFKQNLFYEYSDKLLPGFFTVPHLDASAVDNIGRRMVRGPAALPLETVAMLAMALPIALVSAVHGKNWQMKLVYGLAACVVLAAAFCTYRKSALLAPMAVIATVAYFRRRELLKLAPLGLVLIMIIHVAAPGALGKTSSQFDPSQLGVSTVSDRSADYDAVRPDVWSHLLFGRGWGSYDWLTYRILDSEFLHRTIEMGLVGLAVYIAMILSVVFASRRMIGGRDPRWAPLALMGAASAMSFLVVSMLFDVLAFPHATYIFLYIAGLTSVVIKQRPHADGAAYTERDADVPGERVPRSVVRRTTRPRSAPATLR